MKSRLRRTMSGVARAVLFAAVPFVTAGGCSVEQGPVTDSLLPAPAPLGEAASAGGLPEITLRSPVNPLATCLDNGVGTGVGNGADGVYNPASGTFPTVATTLTAAAGGTTLTVGSSAGFAAGGLVLLHQTQGVNAGNWEIEGIAGTGVGTITVNAPLQNTYASAGTNHAQAFRVPQFTMVTIAGGRTITARAWNGTTGGLIAFVAQTSVSITGSLVADGAGYRGGGGDGGGNACPNMPKTGLQGESGTGPGIALTADNGAGGGGGSALASECCGGCQTMIGTEGSAGGGGGAYGSAGGAGEGSATPGAGGTADGTATLTTLFFGAGGGGGGGNCTVSSPPGAAGGGAVIMASPTVTVNTNGLISSVGLAAGINSATNWEGGGGGGAGGAIMISARTLTVPAAGVIANASGGSGSTQCAGAGGDGSVGRIRVACGTVNGVSCAGASGAFAKPTPNLSAFCSFDVCTTNANCAAPAVCDTTTNACVQCLTNANCVGNTNGTLCDTSKLTCGTCTPTSFAACVTTKPVCNTSGTNDLCSACNGNNGSAATAACPTPALPICSGTGACVQCTASSSCNGTTPVCAATDTCVACNGDNATAATEACPTSAAPYCSPTGACALCTTDAECTAPGDTHAGPLCNPVTGSCGNVCTMDSQCASGQWCDNLSGPGACQPKVTNGSPVPGGSCTLTIGPRACVSAVCDTDGQCGIANGDPSCTPANGTVVCRSMICATSGPNSGKCEQCVVSSTCALATPVCSPADTCVVCNGDNGTGATDACSSSSAPFCTPAGTCGLCTTNAQCTTGTHPGPFCTVATGSCGNVCTVDSECSAGQWCNNLSGPGACQPKVTNGSPVPGGSCTLTIGPRACVSAVCDTDGLCGIANGDTACTATNGTTVCRSTICATTGPNTGKCEACVASSTCPAATPVCSASNVCAVCTGDNGTMATNACPSSGAPYCTVTGTCGLCTSDASCAAGTHAGPFCSLATGSCGNACTMDSECGGGQWCDNLSGPGQCQPKVTNSNPVPGGSCNAVVATRACVSAVCAVDGNCGYLNGEGPCTGLTGPTVCRSMICATSGPNNGLCEQCVSSSTCSGSQPACDPSTNQCTACNGDDGTTATDACPTTASPYCTSTGACGECTNNASCTMGTHPGPLCNMNTGACQTSCTTDAQCGTGNWCDNLSGPGVCQPLTPNGTAVPGGSCGTNDTIGTRACVSGVCDSNDSKCGWANGDGPCTGATGSTVCRSAVCATSGPNSGLCEACNTTSDCPAGDTCNAANACVIPPLDGGTDGGAADTGGGGLGDTGGGGLADTGGMADTGGVVDTGIMADTGTAEDATMDASADSSGQDSSFDEDANVDAANDAAVDTGPDGSGVTDAGPSQDAAIADGAAPADSAAPADGAAPPQGGTLGGGGCACDTAGGAGSRASWPALLLGCVAATSLVKRRRRGRSDVRGTAEAL